MQRWIMHDLIQQPNQEEQPNDDHNEDENNPNIGQQLVQLFDRINLVYRLLRHHIRQQQNRRRRRRNNN